MKPANFGGRASALFLLATLILGGAIGYQFQRPNYSVADLIEDNEYALNEWACNLVNGLKDNPGGCYDWCYSHAYFMKTKDNWITEPITNARWASGIDNGQVELGLSDEYEHGLQNACAIILHGGEF